MIYKKIKTAKNERNPLHFLHQIHYEKHKRTHNFSFTESSVYLFLSIYFSISADWQDILRVIYAVPFGPLALAKVKLFTHDPFVYGLDVVTGRFKVRRRIISSTDEYVGGFSVVNGY